MIHSFLQKVKSAGEFCLDVLFKPAESIPAKRAAMVLLAGLFVGGLIHWGTFLGWFDNHFDIQDWHLQVGPYLDFLSNALKSGQFPMHAESPYMVPDRYLARQNRPFSPQIFLLYFLEPSAYVLANVWILYAIGFVGLLLIYGRYRLSIIAFFSSFILFNLNGHIIAHMAVGHFEWVGYFLLPFYALLVMKMLEGEKTGWKWSLSMAITMLAITLQGAAHLFIYSMAFLLLIGLLQPRFFQPAIKAIILSGLASMLRILPPALQYAGGTGLKYLGGFVSVFQLLQSFIDPSIPRGNWEKEYYVGAIGFAFILYFGIIRNWIKDERYRPLCLPMLVMALFSIGSIYQPLFNSSFPLLDSQRAPTRFLIVPVVFLIILASIQFDSFLKEQGQAGWEKKAMMLIGGALMTYDLIYHSRVWSLENYGTSKRATDIIEVAVGNHPDPPYLAMLIAGSACTLVTLIALGFLASRERGETGLMASQSSRGRPA